MDDQRVINLETVFGYEKKFITNGYYRIRQLDEKQKEVAFLISSGCGSTSVHPQITIKKIKNEWVPIKLIDMGTSPTQMIYRDENNQKYLDEKFECLITKFEQAIKQS
ncbi:MAG: hypothetical protein RR554_06310 [Vagococcus sp.]|uniref:hypothetical protein n=1 Tax=Vagococcus sp. TaxID=1933889 RepID=UPI002FCBB504